MFLILHSIIFFPLKTCFCLPSSGAERTQYQSWESRLCFIAFKLEQGFSVSTLLTFVLDNYLLWGLCYVCRLLSSILASIQGVLFIPRLDGHEFEQAPGVSDGQGSLACCSPWDCKESDTTERLNWTGLYPLNTNSISPSCYKQKCLPMLPDAPGRSKNHTWLRITALEGKSREAMSDED